MTVPTSADLDGHPLLVKRWTRYGKDRLYVTTQDGTRVGWLDLLTSEATIEQAHLTASFHEAVNAHQTGTLPTSAAIAPVHPPGPVTGPQKPVPEADHTVTVDWTDLALNRPGQGVRAEADSLLADMKERSKFKTFLARAVDAKTDERAFRVGAAGEEAVGPRLERLAKHGWKMLHSVSVGKGKSDIDHLLIGPGGVFTINTKNHPGGKVWVGEHAIRVNGQPTHYLRNSRFEAQRVEKALHRHLGRGCARPGGAGGPDRHPGAPGDHQADARRPGARPHGRARRLQAGNHTIERAAGRTDLRDR